MMRNRFSKADDADAAAGASFHPNPKWTRIQSTEDLFEDLEPVLVLGVDISHLSRRAQFLVCASGVFGFSLLYGFLQELISVHICNRQLGLFLAMAQFSGYTIWSFVLRTYVYEKKKQFQTTTTPTDSSTTVPLLMYLGLSMLRAVDLGMTNLAMQYVNYPAKTLMKSSRVVFTMLFGVLVARKRYRWLDYLVVLLMVSGLGIFMHADANSSAVFQPLGIFMLVRTRKNAMYGCAPQIYSFLSFCLQTVSLMCDGAISNMSETIMTQFGVGQDEFIFRMYSIALIAITGAAAYKGDLEQGLTFLTQPGTFAELDLPLDERSWSVMSKWGVLVMFSTMGFFGSSCSAAITKNFGALTMSITSTARKATTLFLSFMLFDNECTVEHVGGIVLFISALVFKSLKRKPKSKKTLAADSELRLEPTPPQPFVTRPNVMNGYHIV